METTSKNIPDTRSKLRITTLIFFFIMLISSCTYESSQTKIRSVERESPQKFLWSEGTYRPGLLNSWVLEGKITSGATLVQYKDIVIEVSFFTKTNTLLGQNNYVIYEFIDPLKSIPLKLRLDDYPRAHHVDFNVISATPTN
jgi:hypothetical protein